MNACWSSLRWTNQDGSLWTAARALGVPLGPELNPHTRLLRFGHPTWFHCPVEYRSASYLPNLNIKDREHILLPTVRTGSFANSAVEARQAQSTQTLTPHAG